MHVEQIGHAFSYLMLVKQIQKICMHGNIFQDLVQNFTGIKLKFVREPRSNGVLIFEIYLENSKKGDT